MFERLVVGYAGDRPGRDAAALAAMLAASTGAEQTIVFPYHPALASVSAAVAEERVRGELRSLLGEQFPTGARYHWSSSSWPIHALHELAAYERAGLIVFGAAHERLERRHLSLMERVVHGSPCAVAIAPAGYAGRERRGISHIGVGFADSPEGRAAIVLASELAHHVGADVRVVAGAGISPALPRYEFASPSLPRVEAEIRAEVEVNLERVTHELAAHGLAIGALTTEVQSGDPSRILAEASDGLDLLVLGSRAYGPLRHALLGSVSADVMRAAHCPVLVLPRGIAPAHDGLAAEHAGECSSLP